MAHSYRKKCIIYRSLYPFRAIIAVKKHYQIEYPLNEALSGNPCYTLTFL